LTVAQQSIQTLSYNAIRNLLNYKTLNYYKNDYSNFDWSILNSNLDTNAKCNIFYEKISSFVNQYVHNKKLSKREIKLSSKPWITKDIKKKMKYTDKLNSQLLKKA
jgi:hypothetical protein